MADAPVNLLLSRTPQMVSEVVGPGFCLRPEPWLGVLKVQLHRGDSDRAVAQAFGAELPPLGRSIHLKPSIDCAAIAPGEWLVTGNEPLVMAEAGRLRNLLQEVLALVTDLTDGHTSFTLSGPAAADRLAAVCPLDLRDATFPPGAVARSLLGAAGLFAARLPDQDGAPAFRLIVDQSAADYTARIVGLP
jgi:sarcosine oxidase subunit gamma